MSELTLKQAAEVFSSIMIPDWLDDAVVVGKIASINIHAGEMRRLREAVAEQNQAIRDEHGLNKSDYDAIKNFLEREDFINAIKYVCEVTGTHLRDGKDIVERVGENLGLRKTVQPYPTQDSYRTWKWLAD